MKKYRFQLGIHPINWVGEDVREHGDYYSYQEVMSDIASLGLTGTEMSRKFPKDIPLLKKELAERGLILVTQWKSVLFSDASYRDQELRAYREHVLFLKEMGCQVISTAEIGGSLHWDPRRTPYEKEVARLSDKEWKSLAEGLNQAGEIAREYGMKLVYHHHGGTVVEQPEEIDRLMEMTDPELVYLLYDTGHAYYGGNDPLELLKKYYHRIGYVHLKDVRQDVLEQARTEGADFITCIRRGVFTVPGDGAIDFKPIFQELVTRDYHGWALIEGEQDPTVHPPVQYAKKSLEYIYGLLSDIE
ncbi:myo-inosose-2 dehydratase [Thermoflavimicrobium dichotomicum]|uniref:Inosose dehydratase n=1 Tax=Thermoflavimicrobium dichotomicum TaxID=46223 RepID=A0A1I3V0B2_9BACL|nr:myo-inosose-2 dehydratase [Thermoflavimicrobium dichotomicum]SFJ88389.1 inosose dehydratase [Thermoflavimicrobium dichotomicum]